MLQDVVFTVTIVLMLFVAGTFAYVALNAAKPRIDYPSLQITAYRMRSVFFWVLVVTGVLISVLTTLDLPYAATRGERVENAVVIDVEGRQWSWKLSTRQATVGDTIIFNVTAADVNHGLGVYDPDMRMIGQTQAMPGYVNSLQVTVDRPGTYKLLCMEYCGLAHHVMMSEITVTDKKGINRE